MAVTLTSTTQSVEEMQDALTNPRYGLEIETPGTDTNDISPEPAAEVEAESKPDEPAVEGKTDTASEPVKPKSPQDEDEPEDEITEEERQKPLPRGVQRKLDRLTRQKWTERTKREALEAQLAELKTKLDAKPEPKPEPVAEPTPEPVAPPVAPPVPEKPRPKPEDFPDSYEDFVEALADWKFEKNRTAVLAEADAKIQALEQKLVQADTHKEQQAIANEVWATKVEKAKAKHQDFDTVMSPTDEVTAKLQVSGPMQSAILDDDDGPEIGYYLRTHPEECERIFAATNLNAKSTPQEVQRALMAVGREFGKIKETFAATPAPAVPVPVAPPVAPAPVAEPEKPQPTPPPVSKAPTPIRPVGTRSVTSTTSDPPSDFKDYEAWRKKNRP